MSTRNFYTATATTANTQIMKDTPAVPAPRTVSPAKCTTLLVPIPPVAFTVPDGTEAEAPVLPNVVEVLMAVGYGRLNEGRSVADLEGLALTVV